MKRQLIGLAATALMVTSALAATDGTLGSTSTGTLNVTATVPEPQNPTGARISGLTDINFGTYTGSEMQSSIEFCVYHSSAAAILYISQPTMGDFAFRLIGQSGNETDAATIPVSFAVQAPDSTIWKSMMNGALNAYVQGRTFNTTSQTCSDGKKTAVRATLHWRETPPAPGAYSGQFQLVIAPQ